jgi:hypothetical protein
MNDLLITLGWLVPLATSASEYVNKFFTTLFGHELQGKAALVKSWVVAILITTSVAAIDPSLFGGYPNHTWWILGPVWGVVVAAVSNGLFQLDQVKTALTFIKARK